MQYVMMYLLFCMCLSTTGLSWHIHPLKGSTESKVTFMLLEWQKLLLLRKSFLFTHTFTDSKCITARLGSGLIGFPR